MHTIVSLYCLYTSRCSSKLLQRRHLVSYQVLCSIVLSEWACNARLSTHVLTHLSLLYIYNIRVYTRTYTPVYVLVNPVSILAHSICTIVPYVSIPIVPCRTATTALKNPCPSCPIVPSRTGNTVVEYHHISPVSVHPTISFFLVYVTPHDKFGVNMCSSANVTTPSTLTPNNSTYTCM